MAHVIEIPFDKLLSALKRVRHAMASPKKTLPVYGHPKAITGIELGYDGRILTLTATDGYRLASVRLPYLPLVERPDGTRYTAETEHFSYVLPPSLIAMLLAPKNTGIPAIVAFRLTPKRIAPEAYTPEGDIAKDTPARYEVLPLGLSGDCLVNTYPDWRRVGNTHGGEADRAAGEIEIMLNPKYLRDLLQAVISGKSTTLTLIVRPDDLDTPIRAEDDDGGGYLLMPVRKQPRDNTP